MTGRMDGDRTMSDYFDATHTSRAPDGLLETALTAIDGMAQRPAWRVRVVGLVGMG